MECATCNLCEKAGTFDAAKETARVRCNVREFQGEQFTVWRCVHCGSLHCLEDIDYERYYKSYPLHRQVLDLPTRRLMRARLRQLVKGGLRAEHAILDYGCGNGTFVRFLKESGFKNAQGYDPFSKLFSDAAVLQRRFDVITSQDVLEHAPDPLVELDKLAMLTRPRGMLVIGTPNASRLDLSDPFDAVGRLHQPYHRHILAAECLKRQIEARGLRVLNVVEHWFVDTHLPFLNSSFLFRYVAAAGGHMDVMFEPFQAGAILSSPRLLYYGFAGAFINPRKDVVVFAQRHDH